MDSKNILEESGDSEVFDDNWTFVDTEEAIEATLLNTEQVFNDAVLSTSDESLQEEAENDTAPIQTLSAEKTTSAQIGLDHHGLITDSDDGVSIITDSEPEELVPPSNQHFNSENVCHVRRPSQDSNDYFDKSDLPNDVPEDLGHKGDPKYKHMPNKKINFLLNGSIIVCIAAVLGLGVGHFVGLQEECGLIHPGQSSDIAVKETTSLLYKLEAENERLKLELKQLQEDLQGKKEVTFTQDSTNQIDVKQELDTVGEIGAKQGRDTVAETDLLQWNIPEVDRNHGNEAADVEGAAGQALADIVSQKLPLLDIRQDQDISGEGKDIMPTSDHPSLIKESPEVLQPLKSTTQQEISVTDAPQVLKEEARPKSGSQVHEKDFLLPYNDDELEAFQTRYVNKPKKLKHRQEPKNQKKTETHQERKPKAGKERNPDPEKKNPEFEKRNSKTASDTFFTKMEQELSDVINRMSDFSTNFVKTHNVKEHVASSMAALSSTMQDMQSKIKVLSESTAQHSVHAMEKVKKSVYKMVQKVKQTSESILQKNPASSSFSSKVMKGLNNFKDGLMRKWSNLKGKMAQKFEAHTRYAPQQNSYKGKKSHNSKGEQYEETKIKNLKKSAKPRHETDFQKQENKPQYVDRKTFDLKQKREKFIASRGQRYDTKHNRAKYYDKNKFKVNVARKSQYDQQCTKGNRCNATDGGWVDRWSQGRASRRRADQESDWVFERAKSRQAYRHEDKEGWYQKRGKSRQQYRENIVHQGFAKSWNF